MASDAEIKSKLQALGAKNIEVKDSPVNKLGNELITPHFSYGFGYWQMMLQLNQNCRH